jgi:hypothetical protein
VITDEVPSGALALGRARQVNKPGWAPGKAGTKADAKAAKPTKSVPTKPKTVKTAKPKTKKKTKR